MGSLPFLELLLTTGTIVFGWHKGIHGSQSGPPHAILSQL